MKISRTSLFLFLNFIIIYFLYIGLAGIAFPKQGIVSIIFPGIAFLFLVKLILNNTQAYKISIWIYSYLFFLFLLTLISSDFLASFKNLMKVGITLFIFPLAFQFIRNFVLFKRMHKAIISLMILYLFNFFIMNFFGISFKGYGDDIATGNIFTEGLNAMAYSLILLPLSILIFKKWKWPLLILGAVVFITLLVSLKRISIVAVIIGFLIFLLSLKNKGNLLKGIIAIIILLLSLYPIYSEPLNKQLENRVSRFAEDNWENEGRYKETEIIFTQIFSFSDLSYSLIGKELFNSPGTYGSKIIWGDRQLHSDYNLLLHGSGILGLLWYLGIQVLILYKYLKYKKQVLSAYGYSKELDYINAVFLSVFWLSFVISLSGGINGIIFNSLRYLILGSIMGLFYSILTLDYKSFCFKQLSNH